MESTAYGAFPGSAPPPARFGDIRQAFDIDRGLRRGIAALRRLPWVLLLGGFLKSCTEGGGGGSLPDADQLESLGDSLKKLERQSSLMPDTPRWFAADGNPLPGLDGLDAIVGLGLGLLLGIVVVVLVITLLVVLARAWLGAGWIRLHDEIIRTGEGNAGTLFGGGDVFASMLGWTLLSGFLGLAAIVVALCPLAGLLVVPDEPGVYLAIMALTGLWAVVVIGGLIYLRLGLCFVPHVITLERLPVMAAIERSFALSAGGRLHLLLYMMVFSFIGFLITLPGYCLCCVGVLVTRPFGVAMRDLPYTEGFLHLTQPPETVATYSINTWAND